MNKKKLNKTKSPKKYALGDFVVNNQQAINTGAKAIGGLSSLAGGGAASGAMSGVASGASIGSSILPGVGTVVGGIIGGIGGAIFGGAKKRKEREAKERQARHENFVRQAPVIDEYLSNIDTDNENPYGVYADGGEVDNSRKKPYTPRRSRKLIKSGKKAAYNMSRNEDGDTIFENVFEFFDPTGISSWDDVYRSLGDGVEGSTIMEASGATPLVGKTTKFLKGGSKLAPQAKVLLNTPRILRALDTSSDVQNLSTKFANGSDVLTPVPKINIEKGELQIDPNTGKILREYNGINPETGGLYQKHSKKQSNESPNNMVTAEDGTFIITKKEASKYKDAIKNNDKLYQNSIMSNIRNRKKALNKQKFADGGIVDPNLLNPVASGINLNTDITIPNISPSINNNPTSNLKVDNNFNWGNIADNVFNYLPSAVNMVQGLGTPDYLKPNPTRMNVGLRRNILNNMPRESSVNPILNRLNAEARGFDRQISNSTSNSSISRALRASNRVNLNRSINDAYLRNNEFNNSIRANRANIYSNLANQDENRAMRNNAMLYESSRENRMMDLAKKQQFNQGVSQLQQMYQNNRRNRDLRDRDLMMLQLMQDIFPAASGIYNRYGGR